MRNNCAVPIAVVGMACRFPGSANSPQTFWDVIKNKIDCITPIPANRWESRTLQGLSQTADTQFAQVGGFIDNIDRFDATFFGISPREAIDIDPQQRMLLELSWQCMEDAAIAPEELEKLQTGVFVGIINHDYERLVLAERSEINAYSGLGRSTSIAANRISYCYNFSGPSITIDTACSSSLTAVDAACTALANGAADVAFAGGANAILAPESYIEFSQAAMLSDSGRCSAFDESADGFVRAEGGGLVLLKRLSDALIDNDRIYATIIATSVNQDGKTVGIMAPNPHAQQDMMRTAISSAGIDRKDIGYVEAHGTGTQAGDTIEADSLGTVYGHPDLFVGSVKTNIGHTEAAAGIAGFIKAVLSIWHAEILPNLHFSNPNPKIDFDALGIRIPIDSMSWNTPGGKPRVAAVNSFGFGGANAHVIVKETPAQASHRRNTSLPVMMVPVSAHSSDSLRLKVQKLDDTFQQHPSLTADISYTAARAPQQKFRTVINVATANISEKGPVVDLQYGTRSSVANDIDRSQRIAFVFNGIGARWNGEGSTLYKTQEVFKSTVDLCNCIFDRSLNIRGAFESGDRIDADDLVKAHAIHFTLQLALAELWQSWAVCPDAVIGHSMGEIAAACVAGYINLPDAVALVSERSARIQRYCYEGLMLAASLDRTDAEKIVENSNSKIWIGALNSPDSVTFSGPVNEIQLLAESLDSKGCFNRILDVPVPFHSSIIEGARTKLSISSDASTSEQNETAWYSSVTGAEISDEHKDSNFWWQNFLAPVQFEHAFNAAIRSETDHFIEIGPHASLNFNMHDALRSLGIESEGRVLYSIHRDRPEEHTLRSASAALFCCGTNLKFDRINPAANVCDLPKMEFEGQTYWKPNSNTHSQPRIRSTFPLLEESSQDQQKCWSIPLKADEWPWLGRHRLRGEVIFPAAGYIESVLEAASICLGSPGIELRSVKFRKMLRIPSEKNVEVTLRSEIDTRLGAFEFASRNSDVDADEIIHCQGEFFTNEELQPVTSGYELPGNHSTEMSPDSIFERFSEWDFEGDSDSWQISTLCTAGEAELFVTLKRNHTAGHLPTRWQLDPSLLDLCFRCTVGIIDSKDVLVPYEIESFKYWQNSPDEVNCHIQVIQSSVDSIDLNLKITDSKFQVIASISKLRLRRLSGPKKAELTPTSNLFALKRHWKIHQLERATESRFDCDFSALRNALETYSAILTKNRQRWRHYSIANAELTNITVAYIIEALKQAGFLKIAEEQSVSEAIEVCNITEDQIPLFYSLLSLLCDCGYAEIEQQDFRKKSESFRLNETSLPSPNHSIGQFLQTAESSEYLAELMLIDRCGSELLNVLTGQKSGIDLLFPNGEIELLQHLYQSSPTCQIYNELLCRSIAELLDSWTLERPCRILEVGSGTGALLFHLAPILETQTVEYTFTDVSSLFLRRARARFSHLKFVEFTNLDLDADLQMQGFGLGTFDMVLASDALHLCYSPNETLQRLHNVLKPGGILAFIELTNEPAWARLVFGMLRDWWPRNTEIRSSESPCLSSGNWQTNLKNAGFENITTLTDREDDGDGVHTVFIEKKSEINPVSTKQPSILNRSRLIFTNGDEFSNAFVQQFDVDSTVHVSSGDRYLQDGGHRFINPNEAVHFTQLMGEIKQRGELPDEVIFLWNFSDSGAKNQSIELLINTSPVLAATWLIQAFDHHGINPPPLVLVTANAHKLDNSMDLADCLNAGLWGFGRTLRNEYPESNVRLVDIDPSADSTGSGLYNYLTSHSELKEACLRNNDCFVPVHQDLDVGSLQVASPCYTVLSGSNEGNLSSLEYTFKSLPALKPTEVLIEVSAASLNFRDVMIALDALPESSIIGGKMQRSLGIECTGVITRVGKQVSHLTPGDKVVALATNSLASHAIAEQEFVIPLPKNQRLVPYSGIPTAYVTALYCFQEIVTIKPTDKVLIHCASGGVGLALIKIAQHYGATIFATAGTPEKVRYLHLCGIEHVADSRSVSFVDDVKNWTHGDGVDVIVNMLGGELASANRHVLAEKGIFIELGKYEGRESVLNQIQKSKPDAKIESVDIDATWLKQPNLIEQLFRQTIQKVSENELPLLPFREFPATHVNEAFRLIANAGHIGKIVLTSDVHSPFQQTSIQPDATYVITGGTRGFGLASALWLAENGAKNIVVIGRSQETSTDLEDITHKAAKMNCLITTVHADVVDTEQFRLALETACHELPPIRGVLHCALNIEDSAIVRLTRTQFDKSINAKVLGAWNLYQLTCHLDLDFFVLYSSVTSLLGPAGQAAYSAANSILDALADYMKQKGVPAVAINWGAVSDYGHVADHPDLSTAVGNQFGIDALPASELLSTLNGVLVGSQASHIVVSGGQSITGDQFSSPHENSASITSQSKQETTDKSDHIDNLQELVLDCVSKVLEFPKNEIELDEPIINLGIDSLLAVELSHLLRSNCRIDISAASLLDQVSVNEILSQINLQPSTK